MRLALTCSYLPREIPLAFGLEAFRPWPGRKDLAAADKYLPRNFCPYVRGLVGWLVGRAAGSVWGVALTTCCDAMRRAADTLAYFQLVPHLFLLDLPHSVNPAGITLYQAELESWARQLAAALGTDWQQSLLENVSAAGWRAENGEPEAENRDWTGLLPPDYPHLGSPAGMGNGPKVAVGSTCLLDTSILEALTELGARVTLLDSCLGERDRSYHPLEGQRGKNRGQVSGTRLRGEGKFKASPLAELARDYLEKPPCPRMQEDSRRLSWLRASLEERGTHGLVWFVPKFCDQASYELAWLRQVLPGLPILGLEGEPGAGREESVRTRLEAFYEELSLQGVTGPGDGDG